MYILAPPMKEVLVLTLSIPHPTLKFLIAQSLTHCWYTRLQIILPSIPSTHTIQRS